MLVPRILSCKRPSHALRLKAALCRKHRQLNVAENYTNLIVAHTNTEIVEKISNIFLVDRSKLELDRKNVLLSVSIDIAPDSGKALADGLLRDLDELGCSMHDLNAESKEIVGGTSVFYFVHGAYGEILIPRIIEFIGALDPGFDLRAWLQGDDDPWEIFYRFENSKVISKEYEPQPRERQRETLPNVYVWWHEGLDKIIRKGLISEWKALDDEAWQNSYGEGLGDETDDTSEVEAIEQEIKNGYKFYGVVRKSEYTSSGMVIVENGYLWPAWFMDIDVILKDMSALSVGQHVRISINSFDVSEYHLVAELVHDPLKMS